MIMNNLLRPFYYFLKRILKRLIYPVNPKKIAVSNQKESAANDYQRFLTSNPITYKKAIEAAEQYVTKLEKGEIGWLYSKPFDPTPGNPQYFRLMYELLNILKAMKIPANARILEVGSGPGWITEILLMLGYSIDSIEPSAEMILISKERCASLLTHFQSKTDTNVQFHQTTIEAVEFDDRSFDAILFFDALHHIVDEVLTINKCFRYLKHGGCIAIVEGAWHPDFKELENGLIAEMEKFGTLENPFSQVYLDNLLISSGFTDIQRFIGINSYYSKSQIKELIQNFNEDTFNGSNNLIALKPKPDLNAISVSI